MVIDRDLEIMNTFYSTCKWEASHTVSGKGKNPADYISRGSQTEG